MFSILEVKILEYNKVKAMIESTIVRFCTGINYLILGSQLTGIFCFSTSYKNALNTMIEKRFQEVSPIFSIASKSSASNFAISRPATIKKCLDQRETNNLDTCKCTFLDNHKHSCTIDHVMCYRYVTMAATNKTCWARLLHEDNSAPSY